MRNGALLCVHRVGDARVIRGSGPALSWVGHVPATVNVPSVVIAVVIGLLGVAVVFCQQPLRQKGHLLLRLEAREETLEDVAARVSRLDPRYLGEIELGWHAPTIVTCKRIAAALDVPLSELVRGA